MARAVRAPTGARVKITITPQLASTVARSAFIVANLGRLVDRIADEAQANVPVESGTLKDSEEHGVLITPSGAVGVIAYHAWYAHMAHNGTPHSPPNTWLLNAALSIMVGQSAPAIAA